MNHITVEIKNVYGNENIYPICETAKFFARIAGTKTLTRETLHIIRNQGYAVNVAAPALAI